MDHGCPRRVRTRLTPGVPAPQTIVIPGLRTGRILSPMFDPRQMAAEVAAAKEMFLGVFARAKGCTNPLCRRRGVCLAGWTAELRKNRLYHPTGGCPVMDEAEWTVIQLGIIRRRQIVEAEPDVAPPTPKAESGRGGSGAGPDVRPAKAGPERLLGFAQFLWMERRGDGMWVWPARLTPRSWEERGPMRRGARGKREANGG